MSKIRVIIADYEGSDAGVLDLLRAFLPGVSEEPAPVLLPAASAPALPAPPAKPKPVKRAQKTEAPATKGEPADAPLDALSERIALTLQRGPMASGDLIRTLKAKPADVYYRLARMREAGVIESREDGTDGQRKNYLVEK